MIQIGEGFDERWAITKIDQSLAAVNIRGGRPRSDHGVSIWADAHGARYAAWLHEVHSMGPDVKPTIIIYAYVQARSFDLAMMELRNRIRDIEEGNPYEEAHPVVCPGRRLPQCL